MTANAARRACYLTMPEAAISLGISPKTLQRAAARGELRLLRAGPRLVRVPVAELERWAAARMV